MIDHLLAHDYQAFKIDSGLFVSPRVKRIGDPRSLAYHPVGHLHQFSDGLPTLVRLLSIKLFDVQKHFFAYPVKGSKRFSQSDRLLELFYLLDDAIPDAV